MENQPIKQPKSLYDSSVGEIAMKHFFAGFMQGLGGFLVTLISWGFIYLIFVQIVLPQISGILTQAESLLNRVDSVNSLVKPKTTSDSEPTQEIVIPQGLLEQLQKMQ